MLCVSYHHQFKGAPTLLVTGSCRDLMALREFFTNWDGENFESLEMLKENDSLVEDRVLSLRLTRGTGSKNNIHWKNTSGIWTLSVSQQSHVIGLLQALVDAQTGGHQYLNDASDKVQIMCSRNEYQGEA